MSVLEVNSDEGVHGCYLEVLLAQGWLQVSLWTFGDPTRYRTFVCVCEPVPVVLGVSRYLTQRLQPTEGLLLGPVL